MKRNVRTCLCFSWSFSVFDFFVCVFQRSVFLLAYLSALAAELPLTPSIALLSPHPSLPPSLPPSLTPSLTPSSLIPGLSHSSLTASPLSLFPPPPSSLSHATYFCHAQVEIRTSANATGVACPVAPANWTTNRIICTVPAGAGKGQHLVQTRPSLSRSSFLAFFAGDGYAISLWCRDYFASFIVVI